MDHDQLDDFCKSATLLEYEAIKEEQRARIGFRDNLLYATIASYAAFFGFAVSDGLMQLLFVPFVGVVLGWTYLVNDEKVSRLGQYVRLVLAARVVGVPQRELSDIKAEEPATQVFSWELYHRNDTWRIPRKWGQCIVDLVVFILPGLVALVIVGIESSPISWVVIFGMLFEASSLVALAVTIIRLNDTHRSKMLPEQSKGSN